MAKTKPTPENKMVARHAASSFGGTPSVSEYLHDTEPFAVPILSCVDRPCDGVTSFSTVGLSDYPMIKENGRELPCSSFRQFARPLASVVLPTPGLPSNPITCDS